MGGKSTTATQSVQIPPEVLARYNAVNARAEDVASRPFIPYSEDPNAFVAALTPSQRAGIENINAVAGMSQPSFMAGQGMIQGGMGQAMPLTYGALGTGSRYAGGAEEAIGMGRQAIAPEQFSEQALQPYMSPYMANVVAAQQALQQQEAAQQRSALTGEAIRAGAFGGDRAGIAQANLARQQSLANQATLANLLQQGYTQGLGAFQQQQGVNLAAAQANRAAQQSAAQQLAALGQQQYGQQLGAGQNLYQMGLGGGQAYAGLGSQAEQQALGAAQAQMAAGQIQQQTDQAAKTALYNQFLQQQGYPYQQAQFLGNLAMGTGALSGSTTTTTQPSGWSDRRLKENVKKIGETFDGQAIYRYNLKGEPRTQIGLMAQEVEKDNPRAVGLSQGYKTLDYKKATDDAAKRGHFAYGGLVPSSMGGAVMEPGAFARGGYADGGDIASIYENKLGRIGSPEEYDYWQNTGMSMDDIANAIGASEEGQRYAATSGKTQPSDRIAGFYKSELGRTGSPEEYAYWSNLQKSRNLTDEQIRDAISSSSEGYKYDVSQGTIKDEPETEYERMAADIYRQELGRDPASKAETDIYEKMLASGKTPAQVRATIAGSQEGTKYDYSQGVSPGVVNSAASTQPKSWYGSAASGAGAGLGGNAPMMATGIKDYPYQQAMVYNPNAFVQSPYLARNAYGFYAAPQGSSYSSFANPMGYQQQATGKGPASMGGGYGYQPQGYYSQPAIPSAVMSQYNAVNQTATPVGQSQQPINMAMGTGSMGGGSGSSMVGYGKGPATVGYPGSSAQGGQSAPQATGKGPSSGGGGGWASGGRISRATGGSALLQQLAAQHMGMYGQMPGAPGAEPFSRIKHTLQQPSAEAQRRLSPGSLPQRPNAIKSGLDTGKQIADLYKSGKELKTDISKLLSENKKPDAPAKSGTTTTSTTPGGAGASGSSGASGASAPQSNLYDSTKESVGRTFGDRAEGPSDVLDVADLGNKSDLLSIADFAARGGRIGYALGGGGRLPTGLAPDGGIDIPDEQPNYKLNEQVPKGAGGGGSGGGLGSAIGTAASIVSAGSTLAKALPYLAAFLPSDRRVKDNAEVIGKLYDGQKVYRYDFGDGRTELGLMAQEVEKHNPDAVRSLGGLKMVDYDKATSRAHKQGGGGLGEIVEDVAYREVPEEERGLAPERVRLAALQPSGTMSDADPIGLGAGAQIASAASREPTSETRPRYKIEPMNIEDMPEHRRRLLEEIGRKESADRYDIMQGNKERFDITGPHPERVGAGGTSTAAGRYQFTAPTWRDVTGGAPMTKEYQDSAAWSLASQEYKARTGRDLDKDLEEKGVTPDIRKALAGRWAVFKSEGDSTPVDRATQIAQRYTKGPWEKIGEELKVPSSLRDERVFVPLVAGLGAMLASDKPRFSQALGEGLSGAAGAYGAVRGQTQEMAESEARQRLIGVQTAGARFKEFRDGRIMYLHDGNWIDMGTAYDLLEKGELKDIDFPTAERIRAEYRASQGLPAKPAAPAGEQAPAGGAAEKTTTSREPAGAPSGAGAVSAEGLSPEDAAIANRWRKESRIATEKWLADNPDIYTPQQQVSAAAREMQSQFNPMASALISAPPKGILATGALQPVLRPMLGYLNSMASTFGVEPISEKDFAKREEALKYIERIKAAASKDKAAFAALEAMGKGFPSDVNSKEGIARMLAGMQIENTREIDKNDYFQAFKSVAEQGQSAVSPRSNRSGSYANLQERFNRNRAAVDSKEKEGLVRMYLSPVEITRQGQQMYLGQNGKWITKDDIARGVDRPMSWAEHVIKNGADMTDKQKQFIQNSFGYNPKGKSAPNILRHFGM
jgi:muramidase (phage lysozyme)